MPKTYAYREQGTRLKAAMRRLMARAGMFTWTALVKATVQVDPQGEGVDYDTIQRWNRGETRPTPDLLNLIAIAVRLDEEDPITASGLLDVWMGDVQEFAIPDTLRLQSVPDGLPADPMPAYLAGYEAGFRAGYRAGADRASGQP